MHFLQCVAVIITAAHCVKGDGSTNNIQTFFKHSEINSMTEELMGFDSHEMSLAYLLWHTSSTNDHMDVTVVMETNNMKNETNMKKCKLALEIPPGIKNFKYQIGIKALKNSGVVLQWLERPENPSEFDKHNLLLRYLALQWFECKTVRGEIVVDSDELFSSAVRNSTNILLDDLYGFEILFPRHSLCDLRWCAAGFLGTGLYAPKPLALAYEPKRILLRSNARGHGFWISAGEEAKELWTLNGTKGNILNDTGVGRKEEHITYGVGYSWAAWCLHDSRNPGVSKCSEYYRNGTSETSNFNLDHGEDIEWVMPYRTLLYKRLYLVSLRRLKQESGICEIIAMKQNDFNGQSFKPLVVYSNVDCYYLKDYEVARNRLHAFYESNEGSECISLARLERGVNFEVKCFTDAAFSK
ncbi:hypothetical protein QAD02_017926 [Eretmocerus hayati]|uniref:Uncharacterized protein n=1 Tax=Eretmocerus hayati TaxID=131215 RepID=A0ACC2PEZ5_9HYME|nr:hypothetical protein QAD02_017926 [Eretmocerus hayati]